MIYFTESSIVSFCGKSSSNYYALLELMLEEMTLIAETAIPLPVYDRRQSAVENVTTFRIFPSKTLQLLLECSSKLTEIKEYFSKYCDLAVIISLSFTF